MLHKVFFQKPGGVYTVTLLLLGLAIIFTNWRSKHRRTWRIQAEITPTDLQFVNQEYLSKYLDTKARRPIIGQESEKMNTHRLEEYLSAHPFVEEAQLYTTQEGHLHATIHQHKPIARIIYPNGQNKYLTTSGTLLPLSQRYTARVPLVYMPKHYILTLEDWRRSPESMQWLKLLRLIYQHDFWRAQIAEVSINEAQELSLYTQISKQVVYFGTAESLREKLKKLHLFYTEILPKKGWNRYDIVDLRFENQIVCK